MKVTIDGITYEGTVDEIREIVSNPPTRSTEIHGVNFPKDDGEDNTNRHKRDRRFTEWDDGERYKWTDPVRPFAHHIQHHHLFGRMIFKETGMVRQG